MKAGFFSSFCVFVALLASCDVEMPSGEVQAELITGANIARHIKTMASDEFQGRKPNTLGEELTTAYIESEFKKLGLLPGVGDSYFQEVRLAEIDPKPPVSLSITTPKGALELKFKEDYIFYTSRLQETISVHDAEIVFAGYGIVAPEFGWNDYEGLDVKGKMVMIVANDPGLADTSLFRGLNKTYYSTNEYKLLEAAKQGATGIITVFSYQGPGTPSWPFLQMRADQPDIVMVREGGGTVDFTLQIHENAVKELFTNAGFPAYDFKAAATPGFRGFSLNSKTSFDLQTTYKRFNSKNVIGLLKGDELADEYIVYTAHWDHDGIRKPVNGDSIMNGAVDNASGVAMIIEAARAFSELPARPKRSILFMALTAEELGLIGSAYYADHPVYPLKKTVACINADASFPFGEMKLTANVAHGKSTDLDKVVEAAALKIGKKIVPDPHPEFGAFYRSDHYNFIRKGVPSVYAVGLAEPVNGNDEEVGKSMENYVRNKYHQVTDEYDSAFNSEGIAYDAKLNFLIGYQLSLTSYFPKWNEGVEYKLIRERNEKVTDHIRR